MPYRVLGQNELFQKHHKAAKNQIQAIEIGLNELEEDGWRLINTLANNQGFTKESFFIFYKQP